MFNLSEPILRLKQKELDIQDLCGLIRIHWNIGTKTLISTVYTRIDQICWLWSLITLAIFLTPQFSPISWQFQAILWSFLTVLATGLMLYLSNYWVTVEKLRWTVYLWSGLMLLGVTLTDWGIFGGIVPILKNLCPLWLGLCAIGYIAMGWGIQSRLFILLGLVHLWGIKILSYFPTWQFLLSGLIISGSLLVLAELQWDMRPSIDSDFLSDGEKEFNRQQHQLRKVKKH